MDALPHRLERKIVIRARPETIFRYFTDSAGWAAWWGAGSSIEPRPGGAVRVMHPGGIEAAGEVLEVESPRQIVFTYGYANGKPIPVGSSRVTIRLEPHEGGTRLHLLHEFADPAVCQGHVQGWRYQLSVFANVVADEVHAGAGRMIDGWFAAWSADDDAERAAALREVAGEEVRFRDRYSLVDGHADLAAHISASRQFLRWSRLERRGEISHCQGTVLSPWVAVSAEGKELLSGTNVFLLGVDGRIEAVTGFVQQSTPGRG